MKIIEIERKNYACISAQQIQQQLEQLHTSKQTEQKNVIYIFAGIQVMPARTHAHTDTCKMSATSVCHSCHMVSVQRMQRYLPLIACLHFDTCSLICYWHAPRPLLLPLLLLLLLLLLL